MVRRLGLYVCGVLILGFGIVLNTKTGLGVASINSLPYAISNLSELSLGTATMFLYLVFVSAQLIIKRKVDVKVLLQIPFSYVMGYIIDFYDSFLDFTASSFISGLAMLAAAIILTALGAFMVVSMDLIPNPADGIVNTLTGLTGKEFGKTKLMFDCGMICTTIVVSLVMAQTIIGIGLGTVLSAALIGNVIVIYNRYLGRHFKDIVAKSAKKTYQKANAN